MEVTDLTAAAAAGGISAGARFPSLPLATETFNVWGKQHGVAFAAPHSRKSKGNVYLRWLCYAGGESRTASVDHKTSRAADAEFENVPDLLSPKKKHKRWSIRSQCPAVINGKLNSDGTVILALVNCKHTCSVSQQLLQAVARQRPPHPGQGVLSLVAQFVRGGHITTLQLRSHLLSSGLAATFNLNSETLWRLRRRVHLLQVFLRYLIGNCVVGEEYT